MYDTLLAEATVEVRRPLHERISSRLFGRPPTSTVSLPLVAEALVESGAAKGTLRIDVEGGQARVVLDLSAVPWARDRFVSVQRVTLREKGTGGRFLKPRLKFLRPERRGAIDPGFMVIMPEGPGVVSDVALGADRIAIYNGDGMQALEVEGGNVILSEGLEARVTTVESVTSDLARAGLAEPAGDLEALMREIPASWSVRWGDGRDFTQAVSHSDAFLSRLEVILQEAEREAERLEEAAGRTESAKRKAAYSLRAREYRLRMADIVTAQRAFAFSRRHTGGVVTVQASGAIVGEAVSESVMPAAAVDRAD